MNDRQPTLLLTRPKQQSLEFLAACETKVGRRLPVVISPILRIDMHSKPSDLSVYRTLILTSSNGVAACVDALKGRQVVTVGERTKEAAAQAGALATFLGKDADALVANAGKIKGPALHIRGRHTRGLIAQRLRDAGLEVEEQVLYDQVSQPLSQAALALLQSNSEIIAPVFSPRSAKLLSQAPSGANLRVIAMSEAVADAWSGKGEVDVLPLPTARDMVTHVLTYF